MALVENTLFGERNKVKIAIERIKSFEPDGGYYLAFSGGKDSIVLHKLAVMSGVEFQGYFNVTTLDPPELIYFVRKHYPHIQFNLPQKALLHRMVEKGIPPLRRVRWCCEEYKERFGNGSILTGIRRAESFKRSGRKMVEPCLKHKTRTYINPIVDWEDEDIWQFIYEKQMVYCSLYDEGFDRLGCIMCPLTTIEKRIKEANRYPRYVGAFKRAFRKMYDNRKKAGKFMFRNTGESGDDWFNWWLYESHQCPEHPDQLTIFE